MKLLRKKYKNFLNVYYSNKSKKYYVQQNPKSFSKFSTCYPWLYWEVREYPRPGRIKYTGKVLDKYTGKIFHKSRFDAC